MSQSSAPFFSIIMPCYNAARFLREALDSVLAQTFTDWELILVDDGSTDASPKIAKEYAKREPRIKVLTKPNGGVSKARNAGIEQAKGEWLTFMDADDLLYPSAFETYSTLASEDVDLVVAGYREFDGDNHQLSRDLPEKLLTLTGNDSLQIIYVPPIGGYQGFVWNKLYKTRLLHEQNIRFDEDIYINEDRLFVATYICATTLPTKFSTIPIYKYFMRKDGAIGKLKHATDMRQYTGILATQQILHMAQAHNATRLIPYVKYDIYNARHLLLGRSKALSKEEREYVKRMTSEIVHKNLTRGERLQFAFSDFKNKGKGSARKIVHALIPRTLINRLRGRK